MPEIKKISHVALVVGNIEEALKFWRDSLGIPLDHVAHVPKEQSSVAFLPIGDSEIELVQPTSDDSGIAKYLLNRGPGMHHICLEVDDLQGLIDELLDKGIKMINEAPEPAENGRLYAFIHPKDAHGVLVELYQLP